MSDNIERMKQITSDLIGLCGELKGIAARAIPLLQELDELGVPLQPEVKAMFLAVLNNAPGRDIKTC